MYTTKPEIGGDLTDAWNHRSIGGNYSLIFSPPFTTNPSTGAYISLKVGLVIEPV